MNWQHSGELRNRAVQQERGRLKAAAKAVEATLHATACFCRKCLRSGLGASGSFPRRGVSLATRGTQLLFQVLVLFCLIAVGFG